MKLIIFTGAPASGKSSLAEYIGEKMDIDVVSKDGFKIALFEKYGFNSHKEKKRLSIKGEQQLHQSIQKYVDKGIDLIVDNNFKNYNDVRKIIIESNKSVGIKCINCVADYSELANRYNERIKSGNRHRALYTLNKYPVVEGISEFHKPITEDDVKRIQECVKESTYGKDVLEVNTTNIKVDFQKICDQVEKFIKS
jgi:chloramphenicol phosphotransferase-like protein